MRRRLLFWFAGFAALPAAAQAEEALTLRRVMLSTAGVGYFEYDAEVEGAATLGLDVPLDQVDDVLKSAVVFDDAGGVGGLELPGRDPGRAAFGDVPFGPEALGSPLDFLNGLQGVELAVTGPRPMRGRLMRAETVQEPAAVEGARTRERTRVTLLSDEGLRQFVLEDAEAVQVADPGLRERIARAVAALRHEAGQDSRHVTFRLSGPVGDKIGGRRVVRVGYVAVAPLWKATYRVVLPEAGATARLQAWAVLENASGTDWQDVRVTLQSGNPVTFHQAIYRSYFVARPEVPVEVLGRLLPDVDTRARKADAEETAEAPAPAVPARPSPMMARGAMSVPPPPAQAPGMAPPAEAAQASEGAEQTDYAVARPVTLAAGHTAAVPLLDRTVPAARLDLLAADRVHPLAALRLTNDTGASLPAGVLTLYDAASPAAPYAGDARLGGLPAGERRLLSFAEDLRTTAEWRRGTAVDVAGLTAARGVLRLDQRNRTTLRITLTGPATAARHVLVEVPKSPDVTLAPEGGARPEEETAAAWRLGVDLAPGETRTLTVNLDRITRQQIALAADAGALVRVLGLQGLEPAARAALERVATLRAAEADRQAARDRIQAQVAAVERDEARLRDNIGALGNGDALRLRLTRQLDADETRLAALSGQLDEAEHTLETAHKTVLDAIGALTI